MSLVRTHLVAPLGQAATYRRLAYVASALVVGPAWFVLLVTGWSLGVGLAITLIGIPILMGLAMAAAACARAERAMVNGLLDASIPPRRTPGWDRSFTGALRAWLGDAAAWREQLYLLLRFAAGLPAAVIVVSVIGAALSGITAPAYYAFGDGIELGFARADTLPEEIGRAHV